MEPSNTYCKNCETLVKANYCGQCGQRATVHKVTFKETFTDLIASLFTFEAPFTRTLYMLMSNPGKMFRDYLEGKRKNYFKPVSFFILLTVVHILTRSLLNYNPINDTSFPNFPGAEAFKEAAEFMVRNINNILFVLVFTLSVFMKLFFFKRYSWAEYMAVAFYMAGVYILVGTLNLFLMKFLDSSIQFLSMVIMLFYFVYAMISFLTKHKILVAIGSVIAYVLGMFCYAVLGYLISFIIVSIR
ncbi:MAG: hypothetical protein Aureis2KO_04180 [Aureisphaera sp.]